MYTILRMYLKNNCFFYNTNNDDCNYKNNNLQKVKTEISETKKDGYILKSMAMAEFQKEHIINNFSYRFH